MNKFGTTPTAESIPFVDGAYTSTNLKDAVVEAGNKAAGGVVDHGVLTGLADDDHPQYLKADGTRALTGTLNMAGNSIVNVGTIDGVTVDAHAARHFPSGVDPLPTGTPSDTGTDNTEGTADAFARQDHVHKTVIACQNVCVATATNTTSAAFALLNSMTLTVEVTGIYLISASATARHQAGGGRIDFALYHNGAQVAPTLGQCYVDRANVSVTYQINIRHTVTAGDTLEIRWLRTVTGTATASTRSLTILKVG